MRTDISKIARVLKRLKRKDLHLFQTLSKKIVQLSELDLINVNHLKNAQLR